MMNQFKMWKNMYLPVVANQLDDVLFYKKKIYKIDKF